MSNEMPVLYEAILNIRTRNCNGERLTLAPGTVFSAKQLADGVVADLIKQKGWVRCINQTSPEQVDAMLEDKRDPVVKALRPAPERVPLEVKKKPEPSNVTKTNEGMDAAALDSLDLDSLLVSVSERVKTVELKKPVIDTIKGMDDPKGSAIAFLTSDYSEQAEFLVVIEKTAKEAADLAADDNTEAAAPEAEEELPSLPKNMLGHKQE